MKELKIAALFPGQGSQYVGMGKSFFEGSERSREVFLKADKLLGYSLSTLIFEGPFEKLTLTKYSQLALFVTSVAIWEEVQFTYPQLRAFVCAGLSLGEYSALVCSGKISFEEGLALVERRANFMHEASCENKGCMNVVLGMSVEAVSEVVESIDGVWIANINCPNQVVISGTLEGLEKAAPILKEKGAKRVLPLDVSGAFHSGLMEPARKNLAPFIEAVTIDEGRGCHVVMNVNGDFTLKSEMMRKNLIEQVTSSVFFFFLIEAIDEKGVDLYIEMGKKTLCRMNSQIGIKTAAINIESMDDLKKLETVLEERLAGAGVGG